MDTPANPTAMPGASADFSKWVDAAQVAHLPAHLAPGEASPVNGAVISVYGAEA